MTAPVTRAGDAGLHQPTAEEIELCLNCTLPECIEPATLDNWTIARRGIRGRPAPECPWTQAGYLRLERQRIFSQRWRRDNAARWRAYRSRPEVKAKHRDRCRAWYARKRAKRALQPTE